MQILKNSRAALESFANRMDANQTLQTKELLASSLSGQKNMMMPWFNIIFSFLKSPMRPSGNSKWPISNMQK